MEHDEALRAAAAVATVAAAHGDDSERGRRLAAPVVEAFEAAGLASLMAPSALGGAACHPGTAVEVVATLSAGDPSTGWCAAIGMGSNALLSLIDPTEAKAMFTAPNKGGLGLFAPGGTLRSDGDRRRLDGRWSFASNCHQAGLGAVGALLVDDDGVPQFRPDGSPMVQLAFVTTDDFDVVENWDTCGMRGTGSHDIVITDATVPDGRAADLLGPKWPDDPVYRLRTFDLLAPLLCAVALGIGRAALDLVAADARAKGTAPVLAPRQPLGVDVGAQLLYGQAEVRLRAARALLLESVDDAFAYGLRGDTPPREQTALIGLACREALGAAKHALETATSLLGTAGVRDGSPLDRLRRDLATMGTHVVFSIGGGDLGRQLAGIHTVSFPFLPPD